MKLFKITCDEATTICDKSQYNESSIREKLALYIHFTHCKICRLYTKHNILLSVFIKGNKKPICDKKQYVLTEKDKEKLKIALEKQILQ
jgi:hypothetical protein